MKDVQGEESVNLLIPPLWDVSNFPAAPSPSIILLSILFLSPFITSINYWLNLIIVYTEQGRPKNKPTSTAPTIYNAE